MNDYYILLYGSLSGFIAEIVGNLSNYWKYMGHYHSDNPFLCSNGMFNNLDEKRIFIQQRLFNDLELKKLINKLLYDGKWNSLAWCLRFYIKERLYQNIIKEKSNQKYLLKYLKNKQSQFLQSFLLGSVAQLCFSSLFQIRNFLKSQIAFSFKSVYIGIIQFGTLFGTYDMIKMITKKEEKQKFFTVQIYLIAQFSSILACFSDSLFYYFINKSSRFYFFYGERILVSKNGLALFLFDWLSLRDEKA
ncbi:unnamed protein product [Paramecium pentaurelia]|uniref:Transmembrane protein n=1 Tax=Paramecium pentaurelia TaxID=43138 RepID=A0A8S1U728_9CILI|nr:unnamed protein product [Paramecium pentaurelia]